MQYHKYPSTEGLTWKPGTNRITAHTDESLITLLHTCPGSPVKPLPLRSAVVGDHVQATCDAGPDYTMMRMQCVCKEAGHDAGSDQAGELHVAGLSAAARQLIACLATCLRSAACWDGMLASTTLRLCSGLPCCICHRGHAGSVGLELAAGKDGKAVAGLESGYHTVTDWVACPHIPGTIVVNVGDPLQMLSDGLLKSNYHRWVDIWCWQTSLALTLCLAHGQFHATSKITC